MRTAELLEIIVDLERDRLKMGEQTNQAIADLTADVAAVATYVQQLQQQLSAGDTDAADAAAIEAQATALKNLIPAPAPVPSLAVTQGDVSTTVGTAQSFVIATTGGTAPLTFSVSGLPDGVTVDAQGNVSGAPGSAGSFSVSVSVSDADGNTATGSFTVTVS